MGHVNRDIYKRDRYLEADYNFATVLGVLKFLENIHYLIEDKRNGNMDLAMRLLDMKKAIQNAHLTTLEKETLYYRYCMELTQKEAAKKLGTTISAVNQTCRRAADKISIELQEGYGQVE